MRPAFTAGLAIFTLASLAGGLSTSSAILFTARAGQGVGGALAPPAVLATIVSTFPGGRERVRALDRRRCAHSTSSCNGMTASFAVAAVFDAISLLVVAVLIRMSRARPTPRPRRLRRMCPARRMPTMRPMRRPG
jgi:MFS family permease